MSGRFDLPQRLALRAATADPDDALAAWRELVDRFDLADLWDDEVYRLLPLVVHRLGDDVGTEHVDRLKGLHRKAWVTNQHLLRRAREVVTALRAEGIEVLVVKGLALSLLFYEDPATRPVQDVDLLVRPGDAVAAWRLIEGLGYRARSEQADAWFLRVGHPPAFDRGTLDVLDVHTALADVPVPWHRAVDIELDSVSAATLSPTDHLLHTLALGWGAAGGVSTRRVVDVLAILDRAGDRIDWPELLSTAQRHHCDLVVADGLDDLRRQWGAAVPAAIAADLRRPAPDRRQRTARWLRQWAGTVGGHAAAQFLTRTRGLGPVATVSRAPGFLADRWQVEHRRHLPMALAHRLGHHLGVNRRQNRPSEVQICRRFSRDP